MKVLIIDPWCSDSYEVYTIGLCEGLAKLVDLTLVTSYYESRVSNTYKIVPMFFKKTDKRNRDSFRKILRGIEYIFAYIRICLLAKKEQFDVIHIQWSLMYDVDCVFLPILRRFCKRLVYTSHNVIPHIDGEKYVEKLRKLHKYFDNIIVHGESIKKEYLNYFPEDLDKIKIQRHGTHLTQTTGFQSSNVDDKIRDFINSCKGKICVFVGGIFYNKGTDRVIKYWIESQRDTENYLLVAGEYKNRYIQLDSLSEQINKAENILFLPRYLNDDEFAYVLSNSDLITIPYRHASMSGIVYSAAAFSKPIVYTNTGSIAEYVTENCGFEADNGVVTLENALDCAMSENKNRLAWFGMNLHNHIYNDFDWNKIAQKLIYDVYGRKL